MKIRVLGCNGGIAINWHTTSFLIDDDILLDGGTGVSKLSLDEMRRVKDVFLTHSHLDHVTGIPLMIDSIFSLIESPVRVHARAETLEALRAHIFNWVIWPDFSVLPSAARPVMQFVELPPGGAVKLGGRTVHSIPVNHVGPSVGYCIVTERGAFAFSGDTTTNDTFWEGLNRVPRLDLLFAEAAFPDSDIGIAIESKHYCPRLLASDLSKLRHRPRVCLTHPKPGAEDVILAECRNQVRDFDICALAGDEIFRI